MSYNILIFKKYFNRSYFFLNYPSSFRYNWSLNKSNLLKFLKVNFNSPYNCNFFILSNSNNLKKKLGELINLKKKSSIFKKNSDFEFIILNKSNQSRNDVLYNHEDIILKKSTLRVNRSDAFKNLNIKNIFNKSEKLMLPTKTIDFKKKITVVYKKNRLILRKFLKVKFKRQKTFNKYIKNFIKLPYKSFLYGFEYKLINILTRSNFFFNYKDSEWFLKNGYVSVNGLVVTNKIYVLKPLDVVNVSFSNYYYFYYSFYLNKCINTLYKFNLKIRKINKQRSSTNSKNEEKYANWIYKFMYFRDDVPPFLEVDYICMSLVLLNYTTNIKLVDYYNVKFLNVYLNRLYNWKFIN